MTLYLGNIEYINAALILAVVILSVIIHSLTLSLEEEKTRTKDLGKLLKTMSKMPKDRAWQYVIYLHTQYMKARRGVCDYRVAFTSMLHDYRTLGGLHDHTHYKRFFDKEWDKDKTLPFITHRDLIKQIGTKDESKSTQG